MSNRGRGGDNRGRGRGSDNRGGPPRGGGAPRGGGGDRGGGPPRGGFDRGGPPRGGGGGFRGGPPGIFQANIPAQVDARITTSDQLVASFKKLAVSNEMPLRPGYGKLGREITLRANFFAIKVPKTPIYDYSVDITPKTEVKSLSMRSRAFQLLEQTPEMAPHRGYIAHDKGMRLVSAKKLPQPFNLQFKYHDEGEPLGERAKTLTVEILFVRELDTTQLNKYLEGAVEFKDHDPLPLISALNMVLQQHASNAAVRFGKNRYFFPTGERRPQLSPALDAWRGYYSSVRPAYKQLMVNVNVCMTAFYHGGPLMDALGAFQQRSSGAMPQAFPPKTKIVTNHLGFPMKKQLKRVLGTNPTNTFFDCEEFGGKITVAQYFLKKYKIKLNPKLPVVDVGGPKRSTYLPAELCSIMSNQPFAGRLTDMETASMIKVACNPPAMNADFIVNDGLNKLGLQGAAAPMNGFGISVDTQMSVIPARILPPPRLSYLSGGMLNARDGSWNIVNVKFQRPGTLGNWLVLVVQDGSTPFNGPQDPQLLGLTNGFWNKLKSTGISTTSPPAIKATPQLPHIRDDPHRQKALDIIEATMKSAPGKPALILFLLSRRDDFIYPGIKKLCDMKLGISSICMQLGKAQGPPNKQDQYFSNVALKVNTKLGGVNHLLDEPSMKWLKEKSTMMVGMDVTHPGPGSIPGTPSVVAVVANTDNTFSQFPASLGIRESKIEIVDKSDKTLVEMMLERLQAYKAKSKAFPDRIFFYRDGVSEGQYNLVLEDELPQVLEACSKLNVAGKPYRPKLTIMICGKRHHARFYPTKDADASKNGNTLPGTVVDKGITSVYNFDFYLQAHSGLQGQVRPTHYTIIYDENKLDADTIQQGTHTASYLYVRATKAVSLVPAAYYADLACERARCYINKLFVAGGDDKASSAGGRSNPEAEKERVFKEAERLWGNGIHPALRGSMFYI